MKITLKGNVPSKKNSRILVCRGKFPISIPSKNYSAWHEEQMWFLKKFKPKKPIEKCHIEITLYPESARKQDLTNKAESIMDLLVDSEIILDDNIFICGDLHLFFGQVDKNNPRADILISELPSS